MGAVAIRGGFHHNSAVKLNLKLSRRRTLLVSLAVSAVVLAVPAATSARLRLAIAWLFEPVTNTVRSVGLGARSRVAAFGRGTTLQQELESEREAHARTRAELAEVRVELERIRRATEDAKDLRRLAASNAWRRGVPVAANVIRRPGRWESCELTVDCGSEHGVATGQAVLAGDSALGMVAEVAPGTARLVMLGHPDLVVPAMIVETRQQGLLEVVGGRLELRYITRDQPVRPGYQVVTSGLDGAFPPGALIGRVGVAVHAQDQPFYKIFVDPTRATASPETVWIVTGTEPDEKPAAKRPAAASAPGPTPAPPRKRGG
jgi:rod shape-determining protein MreC